jgi:2-hydroxychromene-2-carboxylate isomerase
VNLVDELHAVTAALESDGIPYAVCGGVAVTIHGATRTTKDIDLLVRREDVPRILEILRGLGYLFAALPMTFDAGTARERHVQRVTKIEGDHHLVVDLMLDEAALAGFLADHIDVELPEGRLRVVSRAGLLAMKRMAARPQDDADVERLEAGDGD